MAKLIIVIPDLQVPYQDPEFVRVMLKFVKAMRASRRYTKVEVGQIGDLMDQPEVGRWNRGQAGEHKGSFWASVRETRKIIQQFQFDWIKIGNHDLRVLDYIEKYAPALGGEDSEWNIEHLFQAPAKTKLFYDPTFIAPGWVAAHGHEGGLSRIAGGTAFGMTSTWDASVVCGHTHRAGILSKTIGLPGHRRRLTGMEVGHGMVETAATYIKSKSPNWQRGFGLLVVERGKTYPQLVLMDADNAFTFDGRVYKP